MSRILFFVLFAFSMSTYAQFINKFPAKKELTITFKFETPILDNYKWMEDYNNPDLYVWRDNQNSQTKNYIGDAKISHYKNVQDKLKIFYREMKDSESISEIKSSLKDESLLYKVSNEDIAETGGRYGSLTRTIIKDRATGGIKEIHVGLYYSIVKWLDDETYLYTNYKTPRLRLGFASYIATHKVGDIITDDNILMTSEPGDYYDLGVRGDNIYLNIFDSMQRNITVSLFDPTTAQLSNTIEFGTKMQQIGEGFENGIFYHYISEYKDNNYGDVIKVNLENGDRTNLYTPKNTVAQSLSLINDNKYLLLSYKDGENLVGIIENGLFKKIKMPSGGQIEIKSLTESKALFSWQSYSNTFSTFEYEFLNDSLLEVNSFSYPTEIVTKKIFYTAVNGKKAFIWISKKPSTKLTPSTPLILYGYGGWYHSELPTFNRAESVGWIENGGVFAVAAIPGSLAYGIEWNQIAKAHKRENSFDSMALAAKELINRGYTSSQNLGIHGASNGGLLVAGALLKYPKLFRAAVPAVGVYNLVRCSEKGSEWELGNSCVEEEFFKLLKVSPMHNIEKRNYPSVLVMTADQDSVTSPTDSARFTAQLQEKSTSNQPVLIYTKIGGGHSSSSGSSTEKLNYIAYLYSFFEKELGLK
jgi:prolyl oligopeptidase